MLIGAGGHASVLTDIIFENDWHILAVVDPNYEEQKEIFDGIRVLSDEFSIHDFPPNLYSLVNGIGMIPFKNKRQELAKHFRAKGYHFETIISQCSVVSKYAKILDGAQILKKTIINAGAVIGEDAIINTAAVVEHDSSIGRGAHVAPNAVICGGAVVGKGAFVGANATIINGVKVGDNSIIAAGATVTKDIPKDHIYYTKSKIRQVNSKGT